MLNKLGKDIIYLYHTGPEGDQSPRYFIKDTTFDEAKRLGYMLGERIVNSILNITDKNFKLSISLNAVLEQDVDGHLIIKEDPSDDSFIHCAVQGNADYIISGDKHLLNLEEYQGIKIVKPADFIKKLWQDVYI
ncbi:hypothetical protein KAW08_02915 [bacterium]|nr:hypothetical protein [bacterium]